MRMQFPADDGPLDPSWFAPLERIEALCPKEGSLRFFALPDFMVMGRVVRPPRPTITLYKHAYTRRSINLDDAGVAYRYVAPSDDRRSGRYVRHQSPHRALDALGLFELPWLKPGLGIEGLGPNPYRRPGDVSASTTEGGAGHGHLRVV